MKGEIKMNTNFYRLTNVQHPRHSQVSTNKNNSQNKTRISKSHLFPLSTSYLLLSLIASRSSGSSSTQNTINWATSCPQISIICSDRKISFSTDWKKHSNACNYMDALASTQFIPNIQPTICESLDQDTNKTHALGNNNFNWTSCNTYCYDFNSKLIDDVYVHYPPTPAPSVQPSVEPTGSPSSAPTSSSPSQQSTSSSTSNGPHEHNSPTPFPSYNYQIDTYSKSSSPDVASNETLYYFLLLPSLSLACLLFFCHKKTNSHSTTTTTTTPTPTPTPTPNTPNMSPVIAYFFHSNIPFSLDQPSMDIKLSDVTGLNTFTHDRDYIDTERGDDIGDAT